jgi:hypothetical protein
MSPRIVSLVLIAAIIACPLWCGNGLCHAGQCCADDACPLIEQVCPIHDTAQCCCETSSSRENSPRGPRRCQNKACQGVCGGAVFEKPIELPDASTDAFSLPLIVISIPFALQPAEHRLLGVEDLPLCHKGNHGRLLRTLHMSFLC